MGLGPALAVLTIPVPEVSGLSVGGGRVYAVSDAFDGVAWAELAASGEPGQWQLLHGTSIEGWRPGQWEAVSALPDGRLLVLSERPSHGLLVDPESWVVERCAPLVVPDGHVLAKSWRKDENSRGEGVVGLAADRVLVAKEKRPAALVEFALEGADLVAGRLWRSPRELADISDLSFAPDGSLALLSDESRCLALAVWPLGEELAVDRVLRLPKSAVKAEGVAWLSEAVIAVACDTRKGRDNLLLFGWD